MKRKAINEHVHKNYTAYKEVPELSDYIWGAAVLGVLVIAGTVLGVAAHDWIVDNYAHLSAQTQAMLAPLDFLKQAVQTSQQEAPNIMRNFRCLLNNLCNK